MNFVQIFIVTVPLVIIYIYQFMVLLRSNLEKSTFFPVFEVFITKTYNMSIRPVIVSKIVLRLIPL